MLATAILSATAEADCRCDLGFKQDANPSNSISTAILSSIAFSRGRLLSSSRLCGYVRKSFEDKTGRRVGLTMCRLGLLHLNAYKANET